MKITKVIVFLFVLNLAVISAQAQQKQPLTQADYLKKSKKQKTAAWIFTGAGAAVIAVTVLSAASDPFPEYGDSETESVGTVPAVVGLASIATGVYFFIASSKSKKRAAAASVFVDVKQAPVLTHKAFKKTSFPAVGIRLSL